VVYFVNKPLEMQTSFIFLYDVKGVNILFY